MRIFLALWLVALITATAAEAGILRKTCKVICVTVGIGAAPVLAPLGYLSKRTCILYFSSQGDWRSAGYMEEVPAYDVHWLER